jgi:hypothetical protein
VPGDPFAALAVNIRHELTTGSPATSAGDRSLTVDQLAAILRGAGHDQLAKRVRA